MRWLEFDLESRFRPCSFIGTTAALIGAGIASAVGSTASSVIGSKAAGKAADQQATQDQAAIAEQKREFDRAQENSQPFIQAGQQSIGQLMEAIKAGKFGAGSTGAAPQFTGGDFKAPTLEEVQQTPGYQFSAQQGSKGILQGAAAAGGAISGGTLKSLDAFNTNLANSTYGDAFNRALSTYNAGLSKYQTQLAGYGAGLAGQQQEFGQLLAPAQIGSGSNANLNATGQSSANSIAQLMQGIGNSKAAGTIGSANSLAGGISGATSGISDALLLSKLFGKTPGSQFSTNDSGALIG